MELYTIFSYAILLSTIIAYCNTRYLKLPTTTAIMGGGLLLSCLVLLLGKLGYTQFESYIFGLFNTLHFESVLMQGMLSFMLFAGGMNIDIDRLKSQKLEIMVFAGISTILSMFLVGLGLFVISSALATPIPWIMALLFGALISPTDPIAVLARLKESKIDPNIQTLLCGESLFNDGVAIVLFLTLFQLAFTSQTTGLWHVLEMFIKLCIGGLALGCILGFVGHYLIKRIDNIKVELLITLSIVTFGYFLSEHIGVSGPLAMVAAGILVGRDRRPQMKPLREFWELIDDILNVVLFFLLGAELIQLSHSHWHIYLSLLGILLVLVARLFSVALPMGILSLKHYHMPKPALLKLLTWGGLRGGLAVALALTLPENAYKTDILTLTYSVVMFSIIIQGLSIQCVIPKTKRQESL